MATITIEIPDDLAQQLAPYQHRFADLFTRLIVPPLLGQPSNPSAPVPSLLTPTQTHQEVLDFLISQPTSEQIIRFKVSESSQSRLQVLLHKNREAMLTAAESAELDLYEQLDALMGLLKAQAYRHLSLSSHHPVGS